MSGPLFRDREPRREWHINPPEHWSSRDERRNKWRHAAGLDGNGHGQLTPQEQDHL